MFKEEAQQREKQDNPNKATKDTHRMRHTDCITPTQVHTDRRKSERTYTKRLIVIKSEWRGYKKVSLYLSLSLDFFTMKMCGFNNQKQ